MNEHALAPQQSGAVAIPPAENAAVLQVIAAAASNPNVDVDKMQALLDMQERILARNAEMAFNSAMRACQAEIQPIVRDAVNEQNRSKYARYETMDALIRPIYTKHGFSLSFNSPQHDADGLTLCCHVAHVGGHSRDYHLYGKLDLVGIKGTQNKTAIQAVNSSVSYMRRALAAMIFNVVFCDEDKDGGQFISSEQQGNLQSMFDACEMSTTAQAAFLRLAGVKSIEETPAHRYEDLMEALRAKLRYKQARG